ncbi:MAG: carboxymuconolactone decarboxylase family protein [Candidatus Azobacteroides sp.]|nr:carboxymuconolactone decarboxylase family protein [Candidatus Azobacteroides sp.]
MNDNIKKQTAGRDALGTFAPKFAELNDDVLFGEIWPREAELSARDRSVITVTALISGGNFEQLSFHLKKAKENGVTKSEIAEIITHLAFYVGWPKAWSAFNMAKEIYKEDKILIDNSIWDKGEKGSSDWFTGTVWVKGLLSPDEMENLYNIGCVTFEPCGRTLWHTHPVGQTLLVTEGRGWYQERGKPALLLTKGSVVAIPKEVEHWHGAAKDSKLVHIAISNMKDGSNVTWLKSVTEGEYNDIQN